MSITTNEKEYLLKSMEELLDTYDYEYKTEHLNSIIEEWASQKAGLIEAFKRHPQYVDGKFMIAYDYDYTRPVDPMGSCRFFSFLDEYTISKSNFIKALPEDINKKRISDGCCWLPRDLYRFFENLHEYAVQNVTKGTANLINEMIPELKISEGTKTSRAINKICTYLGYNKHEDYNKEFAKYADSLNPLTVRRHTILSINPLDYLTMSFGNSWSSCHSIDKHNKRKMPRSYHGEYSSGTMSYMLDSSSMVLYTVDKSYEGNEYWSQPKINRQMFHYGEDKLIQGRLYPQDNDGCDVAYEPYRNFVQEVMSIIFDFPNLWTLKRGTEYISDHVISDGTHYRDYAYYDNCTISRIKDKDNIKSITIGADPICITCGERHHNTGNISCCQGKVYCARCGCVIPEECATWIDGEAYCEDCCFYCDECDEYHPGTDYHYIGDEDRYVCDSCFEKYFTKCDKCGEYIRTDNIIHIDEDDINICDDCCYEHYFYCYDCDEYHRNEDKVTLDNGIIMCSKCYEKNNSIKLKNEEEA
jgi:hypothetical protein